MQREKKGESENERERGHAPARVEAVDDCGRAAEAPDAGECETLAGVDDEWPARGGGSLCMDDTGEDRDWAGGEEVARRASCVSGLGVISRGGIALVCIARMVCVDSG